VWFWLIMCVSKEDKSYQCDPIYPQCHLQYLAQWVFASVINGVLNFCLVKVINIYSWRVLYASFTAKIEWASRKQAVFHIPLIKLYPIFWVAISFGWNWQLPPKCGFVHVDQKIRWRCKMYMWIGGLDGDAKSVMKHVWLHLSNSCFRISFLNGGGCKVVIYGLLL